MESQTHIPLNLIADNSKPLEDTLTRWLFEDEKGLITDEERDQIIPLNVEASHALEFYTYKFGLWKFYPEVDKYFKEVKSFHYAYEGQGKGFKKWLYQLGIPFKKRVFLPLSNDESYVISWKILIKKSENIFHANDQIVWDNTLNWALYYHHDGELLFGCNRIYSATVEGEKKESDDQLIVDFMKRLNAKKDL